MRYTCCQSITEQVPPKQWRKLVILFEYLYSGVKGCQWPTLGGGKLECRSVFEGKPEEPVVPSKSQLPAHAKTVILDSPVAGVQLLRDRFAGLVLGNQLKDTEFDRTE
jgi:hypothetical protein